MTKKNDLDEMAFAELQRLERLLMVPSVRRNRERVAAILSDDFIEFGSSGRLWTRDSTLDELATQAYEAPAVEDFACRMLAENVALATYRAVRMNVTGARVETLHSSVWKRGSGTWRICFHQATRHGQLKLEGDAC